MYMYVISFSCNNDPKANFTPKGRFCIQSRPRSGSSCKSCLIRVSSFCLWKYDISDPTLVDLTGYFFVPCTNMKVYLYNYS